MQDAIAPAIHECLATQLTLSVLGYDDLMRNVHGAVTNVLLSLLFFDE